MSPGDGSPSDEEIAEMHRILLKVAAHEMPSADEIYAGASENKGAGHGQADTSLASGLAHRITAGNPGRSDELSRTFV